MPRKITFYNKKKGKGLNGCSDNFPRLFAFTNMVA